MARLQTRKLSGKTEELCRLQHTHEKLISNSTAGIMGLTHDIAFVLEMQLFRGSIGLFIFSEVSRTCRLLGNFHMSILYSFGNGIVIF